MEDILDQERVAELELELEVKREEIPVLEGGKDKVEEKIKEGGKGYQFVMDRYDQKISELKKDIEDIKKSIGDINDGGDDHTDEPQSVWDMMFDSEVS